MSEETVQLARGHAFEAERKMGELLAETPRAKGTDKGGRPKLDGVRTLPSKSPLTLAEIGVTKKEKTHD